MNDRYFDKNLKVEHALAEKDIQFFDCKKPPFKIYGLYEPHAPGVFRRMPEETARAVSEGVHCLHTNTAGGRVRFSADSPYIAVSLKRKVLSNLAHMALTGSAGCDLYVDGRYAKTFSPSAQSPCFDAVVYFADQKKRDITINLPLYNNVDELYIGIKENSSLCEGGGYKYVKPVLFYGSSITQGGCASRPGNSYPAIISSDYNTDYINLGFSGNAKAEDTMAEYLSSLDVSAFVYDYDHNAPDTQYLAKTHEKLFKTYRARNPRTPVIFISRPGFDLNVQDAEKRRAIIMTTYLNAYNSGDNNVYFIDGETLFGQYRRDLCTVDGVHPNDLGFERMAKVIGRVIKKVLG